MHSDVVEQSSKQFSDHAFAGRGMSLVTRRHLTCILKAFCWQPITACGFAIGKTEQDVFNLTNTDLKVVIQTSSCGCHAARAKDVMHSLKRIRSVVECMAHTHYECLTGQLRRRGMGMIT
jgi:hypothetical protein